MIGLAKVRSWEEARQYGGPGAIGVPLCGRPEQLGCVRPEWVPQLIRVLGIQRKIFEPYPAGLFLGE